MWLIVYKSHLFWHNDAPGIGMVRSYLCMKSHKISSLTEDTKTLSLLHIIFGGNPLICLLVSKFNWESTFFLFLCPFWSINLLMDVIQLTFGYWIDGDVCVVCCDVTDLFFANWKMHNKVDWMGLRLCLTIVTGCGGKKTIFFESQISEVDAMNCDY